MNILFWIPGGMSLMLEVEGTIAKSLRYRNIRTHAIICDGIYSACIRREVINNYEPSKWPELCNRCKKSCANVLKRMEVDFSYIGNYIKISDFKEVKKIANSIKWNDLDCLEFKGVRVGKYIKSSIYRYLQGLDWNESYQEILREYVFSALINLMASQAAIKELSPNKILMSHAIYIDWGPALAVFIKEKIPVIGWCSSYLSSHFYFRHIENVAHVDFHLLKNSTWDKISNKSMNALENNLLREYLKKRYVENICIDVENFPQYEKNMDLRKKYRFNNEPIWTIFTHINWDSVADSTPMIYDTFNKWIIDTIRKILEINNINFLIKIHPAEKSCNKNNSGIYDLIKKMFPVLPAHIKIIPPEEKINSFQFYQHIDGGITVCGTVGLELALLGKPIILAGKAHYGEKGFTYDCSTLQDYCDLLNRIHLIKPLNRGQVELAKQYAYCYLIQRQIPLLMVEDKENGWWKFRSQYEEKLLPGKEPIIDFICEKILSGEEFIMSENLIRLVKDDAYINQYK